MQDTGNRHAATDLQWRLHALVRAYAACDRSCLATRGVTAVQSYALLALPASAPASMNELSKAMGLAGSTMTRVVDELVRKDLVTRGPDAQDRRVVRVELTEHGRQLQRDLRGALDQVFSAVFAEVPADTRQLLLCVLTDLTEAINRVATGHC